MNSGFLGIIRLLLVFLTINARNVVVVVNAEGESMHEQLSETMDEMCGKLDENKATEEAAVSGVENFCNQTERIMHPPQYPFYVKVYVLNQDEDKERYFCGGAIMNEKYVITTGYCIFGDRSRINRKIEIFDLLVVSGDYSYSMYDKKPNRRFHLVKKVRFSWDFHGKSHDGFNLAFLELYKEIDFDDYREAIRFCNGSEASGDEDYHTLITTGNTQEDTHSTELLAVNVTSCDCEKKSHESGYLHTFLGADASLLCFKGNKSRCMRYGDEGSPFVKYYSEEDSARKCLAGIWVGENDRCLSEKADDYKYVAMKISYFQNKDFPRWQSWTGEDVVYMKLSKNQIVKSDTIDYQQQKIKGLNLVMN